MWPEIVAAIAPVLCCCCCQWPQATLLLGHVDFSPTDWLLLALWGYNHTQEWTRASVKQGARRCKASPTGCGQKPVLSGPDQGRSHAGALCVPLKKWREVSVVFWRAPWGKTIGTHFSVEHGDCTCLNSGLGPRISRRTGTHPPTLLEWTGCHTVSLEHLELGQVNMA